MATIEKSIDVHVPITTAYNQWTQFESFPQFLSGVERVEQIDDTHLHWEVSVAGVDREFDAVITEQHPDDRVAWKSTDGETHAGAVLFERLSPDDTRITVHMQWEPHGIVEKVGSALQIDDMQVANDLKRFKELIESRGFEEGAWRGHVNRPPDATGR